MHFDQRTQDALRETGGLSTSEIAAVADTIVETTREDADRLEAFFDGVDTIYSDMEQAHSAREFPEHEIRYLDLYTHADAIRGYLRFGTWGVPVEGGRILTENCVELTLGKPTNARVRFALDRDDL
ncbi:hypothetical protein A4G99_15265 [Haladaptatus sp. R4]|uniref:DUF7532 family protein n=1 Tax=Haladaptatus sp. R4 TaxID=1679489 RepID=UPI0007B4D84F|nr:hypothetical protein [Haladaptatus sp. R4]KZN23370.1 hypothetical protein A4G99_15265 [Haladaptatus sp. R4]